MHPAEDASSWRCIQLKMDTDTGVHTLLFRNFTIICKASQTTVFEFPCSNPLKIKSFNIIFQTLTQTTGQHPQSSWRWTLLYTPWMTVATSGMTSWMALMPTSLTSTSVWVCLIEAAAMWVQVNSKLLYVWCYQHKCHYVFLEKDNQILDIWHIF